jgi:PUA domain protein
MKRRNVKLLLEIAEKTLGKINAKTIEEGTIQNSEKVYFLDGKIQLYSIEGSLVPTLIFEDLERFPSIMIDMGAIPYICNGADVMAPGIVAIKEDFNRGEIVVIRDVVNEKSLAVGRSLSSSQEILETKKGKVVQNLHYVGDKLWDLLNKKH